MTRRGFSIVESLIAMAILTIGVMGVSELQVIGVRGRDFAANMATASLLAHDLADNISLWSYTDPRLMPILTVTSGTDPAVAALWDMGTQTTVNSTVQAEYAETVGDPNGKTAGALGTTYTGLVSPAGFYRYWNVFGLDLSGTGVVQAKLIQIIVRWNEPGLGMRQVAFSTTVADPAALYK